jgi:DNA-binding CsgD family transcriptional regulator
MKAKLVKRNKMAFIPAEIIEGIEPFWFNNEKWVLINKNEAIQFHKAPGKVQRMIVEECIKDKASREYMRKHGISGLSNELDTWYKCVIGGLDNTPDFLKGKFTPDAYNNMCTDFECPHRGKLCGVRSGLKNYEVQTIAALKQGWSIEITADLLCISVAGMKSRIEKIKEKLGATNMASLIAIASELGI